MSICGYRENERECRETAFVVVRVDGRDTPICKRHADPGFWPPDLRKKLPGKIRRALTGGLGT